MVALLCEAPHVYSLPSNTVLGGQELCDDYSSSGLRDCRQLKKMKTREPAYLVSESIIQPTAWMEQSLWGLSMLNLYNILTFQGANIVTL